MARRLTRLLTCPKRPSCASSDATRAAQRVPPWQLSESATWSALIEALTQVPDFKLVEQDPGSAHFLCTTRFWHFRDDLHLELRGSQVAVRSCSRIGHWDFGTNRRRIERTHRQLQALGILA